MPSIPDATISTSSALNDFLKVNQTKPTEQWRNEFILLDMIRPKAGKRVGGGRDEQVELPMRIRPSTNVAGVRGEMGAKARISAGERTKALVKVYPHNMRGAFGKLGELRTKRDVQSLKSVVDAMTEDVMDGFPNGVNKFLYLDGRGAWAKVASISTLDITVTAEDADDTGPRTGVRHIEEGMWLHATSDLTLSDPDRLSSMQVVGVSGAVVSVESGIADLATGDFLCAQDALNNITDGLGHGVSDATATVTWGGNTYLGIDRTAAGKGFWKGNNFNMNGGAGSELIEEYAIALMTKISKRQGKRMVPKVVIWEPEVMDQLWKELKDSGRQFQVLVQGRNKDRQFGGGFTGVDVTSMYGDLTFFADPEMPLGRGYFIDPATWVFATVDDSDTKYGGWVTSVNGNKFFDNGEDFGVSACWLWNTNLVCERPAVNGELIDCPRLTF